MAIAEPKFYRLTCTNVYTVNVLLQNSELNTKLIEPLFLCFSHIFPGYSDITENIQCLIFVSFRIFPVCKLPVMSIRHSTSFSHL
jgi:hypothetical protein